MFHFHWMIIRFPVVLCVIAAFSHFWLWAKLRKFKVRTIPPASRAHLSIEERQQKVRVASWIALGIAWWFVVGSIVLLWLENTRQ
jgi:hypothetical protein